MVKKTFWSEALWSDMVELVVHGSFYAQKQPFLEITKIQELL